MIRYLFLLYILVFQMNVSSGQDTLILKDSKKPMQVTDQIAYLIDSTQLHTIDELINTPHLFNFKKSEQKILNLRVNNNPVWIKFDIFNGSSEENWVFELVYPNLNNVTFYIFDQYYKDHTVMRLGKDILGENGKPYHYSMVFHNEIKCDQTYHVFVKIKTDSFIILPIYVSDLDSYLNNDRYGYMALNVLYGFLLALAAFNFILFILTKELNYLLLTLYLFVLSLNAYYMHGYGFDMFPKLSLFVQLRMRQIIFGFGSALFLMFSINYLELRKHKTLYRIVVALILLSVAFTFSLFVKNIPQTFFSQLSPILLLSGAVMCFAAGIYSFKKGEKMALYYIVSFGFIVTASLIYYLTLFNVIMFNLFIFNINAISSIMFGLFLTIGLIEKITAIKHEKEKSKHLESVVRQLNTEINSRITIERALRDSEEQFRLLFDLSPQPVVITIMETGEVLNINKKMESILGISRSKLIGTTTLNNQYISAIERDFILKEINNKGFADGLSFKLKSNDGRFIDTLMYVQKAFVNNSNILISVFVDISELKSNQETLIKSERKLRELNTTKDKFFSIIAHDLMNPFNAMLGFARLMIDSIKENDKDNCMVHAKIIEQSAVKIYDLLQNLLLWSKAQSGKILFSPSNVSVVELITNSIDVLRAEAFAKKIELKVNFEENTILCLDQNMISVVIRNLVSNAIKNSIPNTTVEISFVKKGNISTFMISDKGSGIKPEMIDQLFVLEKDTTTDNGTQNKLGFGLGLILCKEFIDLHKGKIWAESELGKGSTFFFEL